MSADRQAGSNPTADPISQFWSDVMSRMTGGSAAAAASHPFQPSAEFQEEMAKQMRRAFLDSWAKSCEELMASEPYLAAMKQSMDSALDFRKQVSDFLTKSLRDHQMPSVSDTDSILQALGSMERNLIDQLTDLQARVSQLEAEGKAGSPAPRSKEPRKGSR